MGTVPAFPMKPGMLFKCLIFKDRPFYALVLGQTLNNRWRVLKINSKNNRDFTEAYETSYAFNNPKDWEIL